MQKLQKNSPKIHSKWKNRYIITINSNLHASLLIADLMVNYLTANWVYGFEVGLTVIFA